MPAKKKSTDVISQMHLFLDNWFVGFLYRVFVFEFNLLNLINLAHLRTTNKAAEQKLASEDCNIELYQEDSSIAGNLKLDEDEEDDEEEVAALSAEDAKKNNEAQKDAERQKRNDLRAIKGKPSKELTKEQSILKYNYLVNSLNSERLQVGSQTTMAWGNRYAEILQYFDTGLSIYEDSDKYPRVRGYYYNRLTGELKFYHGIDNTPPDTVCIMNHEAIELMKSEFPRVASDRNNSGGIIGKMFSSQGKASLTPEKFMNLITIANHGSTNPQFHIPASAKFIDVVNLLDTYFKAKEAYSKLDDPRTEEELMQGIIDEINDKIDSYNKQTGHSDQKIEIMNAISEYIATGDDAKFIGAVEKYNSTYAKYSPFPSDCFKTLSLVRSIRDKSLFGEMLKNRVAKQALDKKRNITVDDNDNSDLEYEVEDSLAVHTEHARAFWKKQEITLESYEKMIEKILEVIEDPAPDYMADLKETIESMRDDVKSSHNARKTNYQDECYQVTHEILLTVKQDYLSENGTITISTQERTNLNGMAFKLFDALNATKMRPDKERVLMINPHEVKRRLEATIAEYRRIQDGLSEHQSKMKQVEQYDFNNELQDFTAKTVTVRISQLEGTLAQMKDLQRSSFNYYGQHLTDDQVIVKNALIDMEDYGSSLQDALDFLVKNKMRYLTSAETINIETPEGSDIEKFEGYPVLTGDSESASRGGPKAGQKYIFISREMESTISPDLRASSRSANRQFEQLRNKYTPLYKDLVGFARKAVERAKPNQVTSENRHAFYAVDTEERRDVSSHDPVDDIKSSATHKK